MDFDLPLLNSTSYLYQQKSMDEMRQSLLLTIELLQQTRLRAEEDLKSRDQQILHVSNLLAAAIKERDEAQQNCTRILFERTLLHHHHHHLKRSPNSGISSIEDDPRRGIDSSNGLSSSDCDEASIASSPQRMPSPPAVAIKGPLPEKGRLLEAVVKAGPLLQTLLLAGPLPRWRHPPPPVDPAQIPPPPPVVAAPPPQPPQLLRGYGDWDGRIGGKRGLCDRFDWSNGSKHPRTGRFRSLN